jgi:hypothetical protein
VFELAAVRGELSVDDREERAVMNEPPARVRLDADGGRAIGDVGCAVEDVGCEWAADGREGAAVADCMSATDGGERDSRCKGADDV